MNTPSPEVIGRLNDAVDTILALPDTTFLKGGNVFRNRFGGYPHGLPSRYAGLIGLDPSIVDTSRLLVGVDSRQTRIIKNPDDDAPKELEVEASNWRLNPDHVEWRERSGVAIPDELADATFRTLAIEVGHRYIKHFGKDDIVAQMKMERYAAEHFRDIRALPAPKERRTVTNRFLFVSLGEHAILEAYTLPIITWTGEVKNNQGHSWETNVSGEKHEPHSRLLELTPERAALVSKLALKYAPVDAKAA